MPIDRAQIDAAGHPNLMRDVLDIFTREKVKVAATTSQARDLQARMFFTLEVTGVDQVRRVLHSSMYTNSIGRYEFYD